MPQSPERGGDAQTHEIQNRVRDQIDKDGSDEGSGRDCDGDNDGICDE